MKRLTWILLVVLALASAVEYEKNDWLYPGFWNLYNTGLNRPNPPALQKAKADAAKWSATMKLNNYHFVSEYVGRRFYFITEYTGDDVVRLAPSFYVLKDKKEYLVWWNIPGTQERQYLSFFGKDGLLSGAVDIPDPAQAEYYAQLPGGQPFRLTNDSPLTAADVKQGLRTDWQHDIPGEYVISAAEKFPGLAGRAVFQRFYLGAQAPRPVLSAAQNEKFKGLSPQEREILANECGLPQEIFRETRLPQNYYFYPDSLLTEARAYFAANSRYFRTDSYFQKKSYLPRGANGFQTRVIAREPGLRIENKDKLVLTGKKDKDAWTIISLGVIDSTTALAELKGVARLTAWFAAEGLQSGYYGWQNIFLDVLQYDSSGRVIGGNDDLVFPVLSRTPQIRNYSGVLEHEFIVARDAVRLEVQLKIPGVPDTDGTKYGAVVDKFTLEKVALQKGSGVLDARQLFNTPRPLEIKGQQAVYNPAEVGLFAGDRSFTLDPQRRSISFDLKQAGDYSGFFTNIFSVANIDELEVSAILDSQLKAYGTPPDWAVNSLEIVYFDYNGRPVYPAERGAERYPKISAEPNVRRTAKGLFIVPQERDAYYAQIKMHFARKDNPASGRPDTHDYFLGKATAEAITLRPALKPYSAANVLPGDGAFYDNIDGQPLSWTAQGAYIEEDLSSAARRVIFDNPNAGGWSALKTIIDIPASANALRGRMSLDIQNIKTGLAPWEGFGFFLEADVLTPGGALLHYSGIPVLAVSGNQFVQLGRMSLPQQREIEYYIPLYHENQKIVKLHWQLALLGQGRVELRPLENQPEASILRVELLQEPAFNPLLWSQYALYSAGADNFQFQKRYELKTADGVYTYEYAELLAERLLSSGLEKQNIAAGLKNLNLDEVRKTARYEIKALPAYARVSTYTEFDGQAIEVSFKTSGTRDAHFNLQAYIVDEKSGNVRQAPIYRLEPNGQWKTIDRVFEVGNAERFVIDSSEYPGAAKKVLLTLGGYHGVVNYTDLVLTQYASFDRRALTGRKKEQRLSAPGSGPALARQAVLDKLNSENLADLAGNAYPLAFFAEQAKALDAQIRGAVKNNKWTFSRGEWFYQAEKDFALSGITLVGETFQLWQNLRWEEFQRRPRSPYWWSDLPRTLEAAPDNFEQYFLLFCEAQGRVWQKAGLNTIRVHQLFTSWADLSEADLDLLLRALKQWQSAGFVIIVDVLPNTDFTGSYLGGDFAAQPYAAEFSSNNDLFKAVLVLPEVSAQYVKPALGRLFGSFKKNNFWPDELTYSNETGFTHGFWTIDKHNAKASPYFSKAYHFYYERYLQQIKNDLLWQELMRKGDALMQEHIQNVGVKQLLTDVAALNNVIAAKYYVKDTGGYVYYNVLREEALAAYALYQTELRALREDGYSWITNAEATGNYIERSGQIAAENQKRINKILLKVEAEQSRTARDLQALLAAPALRNRIKELHAAVFAARPPENYRIPEAVTLRYVDDFTGYDQPQVFFTSFLLPVVFTQDVNAYIRQQQSGARTVIGLNNDYIRDAGELLGRAYLFYSDPRTELRFNKYAHHPLGGHSMLLHPGFGNVFDEDSNIPLNLELFTPPAVYPAQLSETNYTFVGNDDAGEGGWTVMDYLKLAAQRKHILFFHSGPNALDNPLINDYFNLGNRPYQLNTLGLLSSVALHKRLDPQYLKAEDFRYDRFQEKIDLQAKGLNGIAGRVKPGEELQGRALSFVYRGRRPRTNVTLIEQKIGGDAVLYFFGLERNKRQKNRPGNPELIQSFGLNTIQYEHIPGQVRLSKRRITKLTGYYPDGRTVNIPLNNVKQESAATVLDLTAFPGVVCYYLEQQK
ncbi:MAG: hypothetical protein LBQ83_08355 [Candidatus Margulisbacteria bacterium]|jgi:hypothetical protein|nr:hypothetical protein [Candidatus Margulisiibacteriota bacterium]